MVFSTAGNGKRSRERRYEFAECFVASEPRFSVSQS